MSLEQLIEEAREKARKRLEKLSYEDEILKIRLGKYYDLLKLAVEAKNAYGKVKEPYIELDFSHPTNFSLWLIEKKEKRKIYGDVPYRAQTVRSFLSALYSYTKGGKDWMDLDELKEIAEKAHPMVRRRDVNFLFQKRRKWVGKIFEKDDDRVRLRYPIGSIRLI